MSIATRIVIGLVTLWIVFYLAVYFILLSPGNDDDDTLVTESQPIQHRGTESIERKTPNIATQFHSDAFTSSSCDARDYPSLAKGSYATIIIPCRNEAKLDVLTTVQSVIENSGNLLRSIVIIDDYSTVPVSSWPEWKGFSNIHIERSDRRIGVAGAKARGAAYALETNGNTKQHAIVFLDAHVVVSSGWLAPLLATLSAHANSVVYPAIDVLDPSSGKIFHSSNVVGGFDWGMGFKWEDAGSSEAPARLAFPADHPVGDDTVCSSPAAPGILSMSANYFADIGGFDTGLFPWGMESVELSIRTWLCGGTVIRQPCSRVAHRYDNIEQDSIAGTGDIRVGDVDHNALSVAEHWMDPKSRQRVFMSRFRNRLEYKVTLALDARSPSIFYGVKPMLKDTCHSFDWFLEEVYPGLRVDALAVEAEYREHLASKYEEVILAPLLTQYNNKMSDIELSKGEVELLARRAADPEEQAIRTKHRAMEPATVLKGPRIVPALEKLAEKDEHDRHSNMIRETMKCTDEVLPAGEMDCTARQKAGECESNLAYMIFGCPKACGFCDATGKMCVDFFKKKCVDWKNMNQCQEDPQAMEQACKYSCGWCTQAPSGQGKSPPKPASPGVGASDGGHKANEIVLHRKPQQDSASAGNKLPPTAPKDIQYTAQRAYIAGQLPDPDGPNGVCSFNGKPNGQLLAKVDLAAAAPEAPRLFCGIYTMEKNHKTNVKATVSTWGKRCHGFLAFSTVDDHSIPAVFIEHEGEESYDNMWQKSRSIWKYVAHNFFDDFDYFLLGGDDMFYIIENLLSYLSSPEVVAKQAEGKGMFVGRRFFPPKQEVFNSGGAGYLLDKHALKVLADNLDSPKCFPHQKGFWEDVNVANCLRVSGNILPIDTRDDQKRERFHPFTPGQHLTYRIPPNPDWYPKYNPELKVGFDCCSNESISFHYCPAATLLQLFSYFYHCANKH